MVANKPLENEKEAALIKIRTASLEKSKLHACQLTIANYKLIKPLTTQRFSYAYGQFRSSKSYVNE